MNLSLNPSRIQRFIFASEHCFEGLVDYSGIGKDALDWGIGEGFGDNLGLGRKTLRVGHNFPHIRPMSTRLTRLGPDENDTSPQSSPPSPTAARHGWPGFLVHRSSLQQGEKRFHFRTIGNRVNTTHGMQKLQASRSLAAVLGQNWNPRFARRHNLSRHSSWQPGGSAR